MTTRAGFVGILTGLTATIIFIYPLAIAWQTIPTHWIWIAVVLASITTISGGSLAGRWSRSVEPSRCAALGGLAGGLAGVIVFCLLGAAAAGLNASATFANDPIESIVMIVNLTQGTFLISFLGGIGLGSLGGWLASPRHSNQRDIFDKSEPQMALNVSITALPATVIATALAAAVFLRLTDSTGSKILNMPLAVSLLLVLIAHLALTLVVPHEAHEAEHRCGMDEVKMAAYVGIGAAPVLVLLLLLVDAKLLGSSLERVMVDCSHGISNHRTTQSGRKRTMDFGTLSPTRVKVSLVPIASGASQSVSSDSQKQVENISLSRL